MPWTDKQGAEAAGNRFEWFDVSVWPFVLPNYAKLIRLMQATPCRQRD